jgi:G3E family GTPase
LKKSRLVLVSGYLGSGKTTFVRHWIEHLKPSSDTAALVVNEIGQSNLDAVLLARYGMDTLKLLSGCLCCSSRPELLAGLERLLTKPVSGKAPDWVILESSGLAEPAEVLDVLLNPSIRKHASLAAMVTVLDAGRYAGLSFKSPLVRKQAEFASILVANKIDLMQVEVQKEAILAANPRAQLFWTREAVVPASEWQETLAKPLALRGEPHSGDGHSSFEGYYAWEWPVPGPLDSARLEVFLKDLPDEVERVKGLVPVSDGVRKKWVLVQVAGRQVRLHPWQEEPGFQPQLMFIGRGGNWMEIQKALDALVLQDSLDR